VFSRTSDPAANPTTFQQLSQLQTCFHDELQISATRPRSSNKDTSEHVLLLRIFGFDNFFSCQIKNVCGARA
jgi:hypothetical protein